MLHVQAGNSPAAVLANGGRSAAIAARDTPLIGAARHGRAADVAALLADGADVDEPWGGWRWGAGHEEPDHIHADEPWGASPLYFACENGHTEIVAKLLAANAVSYTHLTLPTTPYV